MIEQPLCKQCKFNHKPEEIGTLWGMANAQVDHLPVLASGPKLMGTTTLLPCASLLFLEDTYTLHATNRLALGSSRIPNTTSLQKLHLALLDAPNASSFIEIQPCCLKHSMISDNQGTSRLRGILSRSCCLIAPMLKPLLSHPTPFCCRETTIHSLVMEIESL